MNSFLMWNMWKLVCNSYEIFKCIEKKMKQEFCFNGKYVKTRLQLLWLLEEHKRGHEARNSKWEVWKQFVGLGGNKKWEKKSGNHWNREKQIEKDTNSTFLPDGWIRRILGRLGVDNWDSVVKSLFLGLS